MERMISYFAGLDAGALGIPKIEANAQTLTTIVGIVYALIGAMAVFYMARAALLLVTNGSEPNSVRAAKETILYALVGLVGASMVFGVISFVINIVGGK